jgi:hypothetical protein
MDRVEVVNWIGIIILCLVAAWVGYMIGDWAHEDMRRVHMETACAEHGPCCCASTTYDSWKRFLAVHNLTKEQFPI